MAIDRQSVYHKRDRLRQLRAFCYAAKFESMTLSAEHLGITQPSVSLHVRELEAELEAMLFDRAGPRITLTAAGRFLYQLTGPLVEAVDRLPGAFADDPDAPVAGELHVVAGPTAIAFVLPRYLKRFHDDRPEVRTRLTRGLVQQGLKLLLAREADLVVGAREPVTESFDYYPVSRYDLVLITPEDHPLAEREWVDVGEAAEYPAVVPPAGTYNRQFEESIADRFASEAEVALEANGWGVIKQYVEHGFGVSVVPTLCLDETDRVRSISLGPRFRNRSYGVFARRGTPLSPHARGLLRTIAADFPDLASALPAK